MYPQVFGKYVLERELARGGMARVVLATLRGAGGFEKKLVVKQIRDELAFDSEWVRRFVEEAKTTVSLSHPNIVPVYELGVEQGTYFLAMELVEGMTVAELLKNGGALSPEEGAYVGVEICRALDYAHRRMAVVHRDLTPRNVMVDEEGQVKVIDFGIAAPSEVAGHEVFGSPGHMPPEQIAGAALGPSTDIFAVAATLMEAWSAKAPFRRKTLVESEQAMRGEHPKPSGTNQALAPLDALFESAMALDPAARPQSADDLGKGLRRFLSGADTVEVARGLGERVRATRAAAAESARAAAEPSVRPRSPSLGEAGTKTFAARREVGDWAKSDRPPKLLVPTPATPVVTIDPGTRKLPRSVPPPPVQPDVIETIATASLERSVRPKPPWSGALAAIAAGAAATLVAAFVLLRPPPRPVVGSDIVSHVASAAPNEPVVSKTVPLMNEPSPPPGPSAATRTSPPSSSASGRTPLGGTTHPSPADPSADAPSHLTLLADPGTRVSIDGATRGHCPLRDVPLDPGLHEIRFTFEPTGESSGERITLRAGERATLRADFSSATPTLRLER
jgi:tRNA A-37 threonylcarbamoyl transferase component Bud32